MTRPSWLRWLRWPWRKKPVLATAEPVSSPYAGALSLSGVGRSRRRYLVRFSDGSAKTLDNLADLRRFALGATDVPLTLEEAQARLVADWLAEDGNGSCPQDFIGRTFS